MGLDTIGSTAPARTPRATYRIPFAPLHNSLAQWVPRPGPKRTVYSSPHAAQFKMGNWISRLRPFHRVRDKIGGRKKRWGRSFFRRKAEG